MKFRRIVWIIIIALVLLSAFRIISKIKSAKNSQIEKVIPVVVQNPKTGTIESKLSLTGDIKAESEVTVRPRVAGRVAEIYVKEGDYVAKNDKLLSYVLNIESDSSIYEDMVVRSPINGVIGAQLIKIGEQVTSQPGSINSVFIIYGIDKVKIICDASEKYYSKIKEGIPAVISLDAYPNEMFFGSINNIRPVIDPLSRTTQIEIILPNTNHKIKPGMFAKVELIMNKISNALMLPSDAVLGDGDKFVFIEKDGVAKKIKVSVGIQDENNNVEIISGLSSSDKVITVGQRVVVDGAAVKEAAID